MAENLGSTAAREAIRIAAKYLPGGTLEQRRALATEIVDVIVKCENELANEIVLALRNLPRGNERTK